MGKENKELKEEKKTEKNTEVKKIEEPVQVENNKKIMKLIQIILIGVVLIAIFMVILHFTKASSLEDKLNSKLKNMGEDFYTEFYYPEITKGKSTSEINEFLSSYKDVGIKVNLDNLSRYKEDEEIKKSIEEFKNEKGKKCNDKSTRVIIYPKSPYGNKDYTVKVELDCGFSNNNQ